ncbi:MAG: OmpH family outer membrane protein [Treponema sp.]|nr:OmpH family outer membrane protein [Treponema sp.]
MNKKILISVLFSIFTISGVFAQQITKFGVVDTNKVYNAYFRNSTAVRNYEKKRADYQNEINKTTDELRELQQKKIDLEKNGNEAQALKVEAEITRKKDYLTEYTNAKNVELESLAKSLKNSDEFYKKLYSTLSRIAEGGGYSMILSLQESNAILWYSNSVDITEDVIKQLGL